jgi:hypothetical protein
MCKYFKLVLVTALLAFCIEAAFSSAYANTIIASNLSKQRTNYFIKTLKNFYSVATNVKENGAVVKNYFTKNFSLYSNSQIQTVNQLVSHINYLHKNYVKIVKSPFQIIQITNNFVTLKYKVYLTDKNKKQSGYNFIVIYHFVGNKMDKAWEVSSPLSAKNIK